MDSNDKDVIDLFCGCGGFSTGFKQAGFNIIYALDVWNDALQSHQLNHPKCKHLLVDIRKVKDFPSVPIVIGSPPCQEFSTLNPNGSYEKGLELVREFERVVDIVKPKYWVWENVPFVSNYYYNHFFLNSFDFGLAQRRKRCFVSNFTFVLEKKVRGRITPIYRYDGSKKPITSKCQKSHSTYSGTVCAGNRVSNTETNQFLTINEVKELMGFPIDYKLHGGISSQQKQLGNAVCPPCAKAIAEAIRDNKTENNLRQNLFNFDED